MSGANDNSATLDRALDLLVAVHDEPLIMLPGGDPGENRAPTAIRLAHFKPEVSNKIAALLEEQGR